MGSLAPPWPVHSARGGTLGAPLHPRGGSPSLKGSASTAGLFSAEDVKHFYPGCRREDALSHNSSSMPSCSSQETKPEVHSLDLEVWAVCCLLQATAELPFGFSERGFHSPPSAKVSEQAVGEQADAAGKFI